MWVTELVFSMLPATMFKERFDEKAGSYVKMHHARTHAHTHTHDERTRIGKTGV